MRLILRLAFNHGDCSEGRICYYSLVDAFESFIRGSEMRDSKPRFMKSILLMNLWICFEEKQFPWNYSETTASSKKVTFCLAYLKQNDLLFPPCLNLISRVYILGRWQPENQDWIWFNEKGAEKALVLVVSRTINRAARIRKNIQPFRKSSSLPQTFSSEDRIRHFWGSLSPFVGSRSESLSCWSEGPHLPTASKWLIGSVRAMVAEAMIVERLSCSFLSISPQLKQNPCNLRC